MISLSKTIVYGIVWAAKRVCLNTVDKLERSESLSNVVKVYSAMINGSIIVAML